MADEGEGAATASADWVDVVDRGGLLHVKEGTYMLFCAMEEEVREHFRMENVTNVTEGNREQVEGAVMDNDEVLFQWCMLTADVSDADATVVYTRNASQAVDSNSRFLVRQRMARTPQAAEKEESATLKSSPKGHSLDPANNYYDTVLHTKSYCIHASEL